MKTERVKIHFTIVPTDHGFTYQLYEWGFLHKIATLLGYVYFHIPFDCDRSKPISSDESAQASADPIDTDTYRFLGITQHFQALNVVALNEFERHIEIYVPENLIWKRSLWDIALLMSRIRKKAAQQIERDKKTLIRLIVDDTRSPDKLVPVTRPPSQEKAIPRAGILRALYYAAGLALRTYSKPANTPWQHGPDLYPVYLEQRKARPWRSRFLPGKTKVVIHIRRGDLATVKTPWNKTIDCLTRGHRCLSAQNFKRFMEELTARMNEHRFSTLFFSDGHKRTFDFIKKNSAAYNLSNAQIEILARQLAADEKQEFENLKDIENSKTIIGETPENLSDFVHSMLTADIIVTDAQHKFVRKLGALYFAKNRAPVIIFLHEGNYDINKYPPLPPPSDKTIFFNMCDPDYAALVERLKKFLP